MEANKSIESNAKKSVYSVVEQINAGYDKFFDSKPKASEIRSECYSNYKTCGTTSNNNIPKRCAGVTVEEIKSENDSLPANNGNGQNVMQQFFPRADETKQCQRINNGSGCCKYASMKTKK